MSARKFIVSCDNCADMPKSWYERNDVHCLPIKRILGGKEFEEIFDKDAEFDTFYEELKRGELPTTSAINPFEFKERFEKLLKGEPNCDLIHISLSSGLSVTFNNAKSAAAEVTKGMDGKHTVYAFDSLMGTLGMGDQVEELVKLRDQGMSAEDAVAHLETYRDHQHGWVIMSDLFHLKRGGRIKPAQAIIGAALNIRPIIHLSAKGKLPVENKVRGNIKAVKYILSRMEKYGDKYMKENGGDFSKSTVWVVRTSNSDLYTMLHDNIRATYPDIHIKTGIVGPVIGTHLGNGGAAVLFHGAPRLDIE